MRIRLFKNEDALGVLECHYSAVHELASKDYSQDILDEWAPEINVNRIKDILDSESEIIRFVAEKDKKIIGFSEYVLKQNELRACYVHASYSSKGVASELIKNLENDALKNNLNYLGLDSSITAMPFYKKMGYEILFESDHVLSSGSKMKCYKMNKNLSGLSELSGKNIL